MARDALLRAKSSKTYMSLWYVAMGSAEDWPPVAHRSMLIPELKNRGPNRAAAEA